MLSSSRVNRRAPSTTAVRPGLLDTAISSNNEMLTRSTLSPVPALDSLVAERQSAPRRNELTLRYGVLKVIWCAAVVAGHQLSGSGDSDIPAVPTQPISYIGTLFEVPQILDLGNVGRCRPIPFHLRSLSLQAVRVQKIAECLHSDPAAAGAER